MKRWMSLPLVLLMLWPAAAMAQEEGEAAEGPTWWAVFSEHVQPSMIDEFEANSEEMIGLIRANAPADLTYYTLSGPETGYMYAVPMDSYEQFMEIGEKWEAMVQKIGPEKWAEMDAKSSAGVTSRELALYVQRADLSYWPENPRLTMDDAPMRHYDYAYAIPGKERELEGVLREWVDLYKSHDANSGWTVYQAFSGEDLPLYVIGTIAKNRADYEEDGNRLDELMGDADDALWVKTRNLMRKFDHTDAWMRPELSLVPESMAQEGMEEQEMEDQ